MYMICTFPSLKIDIEKYPAVKSHLLSFKKEKLEQTGKTHLIDGQTIKSRKKTNNKWFETQDSISYWNDFYRQKIIYPCIMANEPCFMLDDGRFFTPAPGNIIIGDNIEFLLGILCSKTYYFALRKYYMGGGIEGELKTNRLLKLPIIPINDSNLSQKIVHNVKKIVADNLLTKELITEVDEIIMNILNFTNEEKQHIFMHNI